MTKSAYQEYLGTAAWQSRRARALRLARYRCAWCESRRRLQVHHLTYRRLGRELDADLLVLCGKCHEKVHGLAPSRWPQYAPPPRTNVAERHDAERAARRAEADAREYRAVVLAAVHARPRGRRFRTIDVARTARCPWAVVEPTLWTLAREGIIASVGASWVARTTPRSSTVG